MSSVMAPIFLMYQTRSVFQVLTGRDGGWPTNNRGRRAPLGRRGLGRERLDQRWSGRSGLVAVYYLAPGLVLWLLPVALPMILAPLVISWFSQDSRSGLMAVPSELQPAPIIGRHVEILRAWLGDDGILPDPADAPAGAAAPLHA